MQQKMADLPEHRLLQTPPFYHSGIDVFGPFMIKEGRATRASTGTRKIWCLLFTCLYSRGVHVETLDHMNTDSFKMAFQRFQYVRGECVYLRSDHGSNFIGAYNEQLPPGGKKLQGRRYTRPNADGHKKEKDGNSIPQKLPIWEAYGSERYMPCDNVLMLTFKPSRKANVCWKERNSLLCYFMPQK